MNCRLTLGLALACHLLTDTARANDLADGQFDVGNPLLDLVGLVILVTGAFMAVLHWRSRSRRIRSGATKNLELVEALHVGGRRSVLLVRVGNQTRLIGTSEAGLIDLGPASIDAMNEKAEQ